MNKRKLGDRFREEQKEGETLGDLLKARMEDTIQTRKKLKEEKEKQKKDFEENVKSSRPVTYEQILEETIDLAKNTMIEQSGKGMHAIFYTIGKNIDVDGYACSLFPDETKKLANDLRYHYQAGHGLDVVSKNDTVTFQWKSKFST